MGETFFDQPSWWLNTVAAEEAQAAHLLDHLDQAVLGKAFRRELVPQDPNEPAEKLLDRILAAHEGLPRRKGGEGEWRLEPQR